MENKDVKPSLVNAELGIPAIFSIKNNTEKTLLNVLLLNHDFRNNPDVTYSSNMSGQGYSFEDVLEFVKSEFVVGALHGVILGLSNADEIKGQCESAFVFTKQHKGGLLSKISIKHFSLEQHAQKNIIMIDLLRFEIGGSSSISLEKLLPNTEIHFSLYPLY